MNSLQQVQIRIFLRAILYILFCCEVLKAVLLYFIYYVLLFWIVMTHLILEDSSILDGQLAELSIDYTYAWTKEERVYVLFLYIERTVSHNGHCLRA